MGEPEKKEPRVYECYCGKCRKKFKVPVEDGFPKECSFCHSREWTSDKNGREQALGESA